MVCAGLRPKYHHLLKIGHRYFRLYIGHHINWYNGRYLSQNTSGRSLKHDDIIILFLFLANCSLWFVHFLFETMFKSKEAIFFTRTLPVLLLKVLNSLMRFNIQIFNATHFCLRIPFLHKMFNLYKKNIMIQLLQDYKPQIYHN